MRRYEAFKILFGFCFNYIFKISFLRAPWKFYSLPPDLTTFIQLKLQEELLYLFRSLDQSQYVVTQSLVSKSLYKIIQTVQHLKQLW